MVLPRIHLLPIRSSGRALTLRFASLKEEQNFLYDYHPSKSYVERVGDMFISSIRNISLYRGAIEIGRIGP